MLSGESANAVPHYQKLCSRDSHIWGIRRGQHNRSAMAEPRPGWTTFLIMVSPLPGKYELYSSEAAICFTHMRWWCMVQCRTSTNDQNLRLQKGVWICRTFRQKIQFCTEADNDCLHFTWYIMAIIPIMQCCIPTPCWNLILYLFYLQQMSNSLTASLSLTNEPKFKPYCIQMFDLNLKFREKNKRHISFSPTPVTFLPLLGSLFQFLVHCWWSTDIHATATYRSGGWTTTGVCGCRSSFKQIKSKSDQ